jgi:peptidoglycan/xylan/chitin deacetylase (PgdA/CDA1 family)
VEIRATIKTALARAQRQQPAQGATLLIYHRVGGGTTIELDLPTDAFVRQLDLLVGHHVLALDTALDQLETGDHTPSFVLTFDDGFLDVFHNAWPLLRERRMPFTIYLTTSFVGGNPMRWEGSTSTGEAGTSLTWDQLAEMVGSGLCTVGNHTHSHVRPEVLGEGELDDCSAHIEQHLGVLPRHFTYPWGIPVPRMESALRARFRSASTGQLGRNLPGADPMRLTRVPVRGSDPDAFFAAKLVGDLGPERAYAGLVASAKRARAVVRRG